MPEVILRLRADPVTGKRQLVVDYRSDSDALPMEHEEEHRNLVEGILEGGAAKAVAEGKVEVEREAPVQGEGVAAGEGAAPTQRRAVESKE
jgi:hypothetical protein